MERSEDRISVHIGIFARNEAERIPHLLEDLAHQTLLLAPSISVGISVIANGCSDDTAGVVRSRFTHAPFSHLAGGAEVAELTKPGKSNAWNEFVHALVPRNTDYVFFLDADIRIPGTGYLKLIVEQLSRSTTAVVAVDRSVKDIELEMPTRLSERLIKAGTGTANDTTKAIAGALYCVRYSEAVKLYLPIGLPGEDGFIRAMLLTSNLSHPERLERLLFVDDAYHVFESLRSVSSVTRHNVRLAIGTAINILLFHHLRQIGKSGSDVRDYVRSQNIEDPDWINKLVRERLELSYFPLEPIWLLRRWREKRRLRSARDVAVLTLGLCFDLVVFGYTTLLMRRGAGAGYW